MKFCTYINTYSLFTCQNIWENYVLIPNSCCKHASKIYNNEANIMIINKEETSCLLKNSKLPCKVHLEKGSCFCVKLTQNWPKIFPQFCHIASKNKVYKHMKPNNCVKQTAKICCLLGTCPAAAGSLYPRFPVCLIHPFKSKLCYCSSHRMMNPTSKMSTEK